MDDLIERLDKAEALLRDALETPHADAVKDARAKIASDAATIAMLTGEVEQQRNGARNWIEPGKEDDDADARDHGFLNANSRRHYISIIKFLTEQAEAAESRLLSSGEPAKTDA